ncbi:helix-turn-helix domain-containing protein [Paraburkholderia sp. RCC_158]|uniref:helix-turn-helix domain-containing protein n=1 Tax=Paraburkholderia sp. RCC_158 TaxID=3239220 RepID=UPI003525642E
MPADNIRLAARWLRDVCHRRITAGDAAAAAAMSGSSFSREFPQEMGVLPLDYLVDLRLQTACRLLLETDSPIDQVARRAGMSSGAHLARNFRTRLKLLPSEYRAYHRDGPSRRSRMISAPALVLRIDLHSDRLDRQLYWKVRLISYADDDGGG